MKYSTKIVLVVCLTVSILSGFIPILFTANVQAGQGSATYSGRLFIEFREQGLFHSSPREVQVHAESEIVGSLDQNGRFDLSSTSGTGTCVISTSPKGGHVDRQVFIGTPKFRLSGDTKTLTFSTDLFISSRCSISNILFSGFAFHNDHSDGFKSKGTFIDNTCFKLNEFEVSCFRELHWNLVLIPTSLK